MHKTPLFASLALVVSLATASAETAAPTAAYDLLFREGTLDQLDGASTLVYRRDIVNAAQPDFAAHFSGDVALSLADSEPSGLAQLTLRQEDRSRPMGRFPASVGNPIIMVFYESVIRDMAQTAGGSPFYIRNRVKDALVQDHPVEIGTATVNGQEISTQTVRMRPFEGDPNADRMVGFGSLELTVTMSGDVPGWYVSLVAQAGAQEAPIYVSDLRFVEVEE